jgi:hypothetical protein
MQMLNLAIFYSIYPISVSPKNLLTKYLDIRKTCIPVGKTEKNICEHIILLT